MNYRAMAYYLGIVLEFEALLMLAPLLVALFCGEYMAAWGFFAAIALLVVTGMLLTAAKGKREDIYAREGLLVVAASWLGVSLFGALPYHISGAVPSFTDCLFESVSAFSTTAATIIDQVEALPRSLLVWRGLSLWVGGVGVLVFLMALAPIFLRQNAVHLLRAEMPGHAPGRVVPRLRESARILSGIYLGLTALQTALLLLGGMPLFDSILNAMGTAATGGFPLHSGSIAAYGSTYAEAVTAVFMVLSGLNFNIHYYLLIRNFSAAARSEEARAYLGVIAAATAVVGLDLWGKVFATPGGALRSAFFHVTSIATTTGFYTMSLRDWPQLSQTILLLLMFVGACSGSTGGGIKVSRVLILFKEAGQVLFRMLHPQSTRIVKLDGKRTEREAVHEINVYFFTLIAVWSASLLLVLLDNVGWADGIFAVSSCLNNIGAGFGIITETGSYAHFPALSKLVLALDMLLGRLELFPLLILLSPRTWRRA